MANYFSLKRTGETITLTFDFKKLVGTGETISSAEWQVEVVEGVDAAPGDMESGAPSISGLLVSQLITGGVVGNTYRMICRATTSANQIIDGTALLEVADDKDI